MRHGETLWNREGRLLGWTDLPLTAEGEAQARRLKGALPSLPALRGFPPASTLSFGRSTSERWRGPFGRPWTPATRRPS